MFEKTIEGIFPGRIVNAVKHWRRLLGGGKSKPLLLTPELASSQDEALLLERMHGCLESKGGELTARQNTIELGSQYLSLSEVGKRKFLKLFVREFRVDLELVSKILSNDDKLSEFRLENRVISATKSSRTKILKQFLSFEEGLKFLIDMRRDVLSFLKDDIDLICLETELRELLSNWLDVGMLDLRQITWDSPASLLEKLIIYEAVHQISSWRDLRNRLDSDRRCFAFFHHKVPTEPLIFVEVALTAEISGSIHHLLDEEQPSVSNHNTAVFYSISSTQAGLAKINLGNFLIKRVVSLLSAECPYIKTFVTLSPIPGFMKWLKSSVEAIENDALVLGLINAKQVRELFTDGSADMIGSVTQDIKEALVQLCAYYLLYAKRSNKAMDPVANFHLSNGAMIKRLNWGANLASRGIEESCGIMVNYLYELTKIESRHEEYMVGGQITAERDITKLAKACKKLNVLNS